jgi:hypothetical protein
MAEDYLEHAVAPFGQAEPGRVNGPAALRQTTQWLLAQFPDLHMRIEAIVAEGGHRRGAGLVGETNLGPLNGVAPPTGNHPAPTTASRDQRCASSAPSIAPDPIAISIEAVRVPVLMTDVDPVADVGTVQIGWRWRKAVAGICRVAAGLRLISLLRMEERQPPATVAAPATASAGSTRHRRGRDSPERTSSRLALALNHSPT